MLNVACNQALDIGRRRIVSTEALEKNHELSGDFNDRVKLL